MMALLLLLVLASATLAEDCTMGFSVVAPELAVPGKTTAVLVTLHGPKSFQPLNVTLKLYPDPADGPNREPVETTQEIRGHGILPLEVPAEATGSYILQTQVNCTTGQACSLQSSSQMRLVGPVRDVIIRPAKRAYRPGETISFWVLALDHDLQIASSSIGTVSVKDPVGTKVAIWDQVSLEEGVKAFNLPLSEYVRSGRWLLHVEVENSEFSAPIEVTQGAGNSFADVAVAEEHYVELRFGKEMRRRYKPGLPFSGKVEAMSTEKSVRVRVKVYDNTTSIYSQDIEITNGEGTFVVPAILADSDVIALQAELVSVESKEIESHYVLAREPIHKWNSSSDCYLLIEGVEHTLQPEEEAHVAILSTCPCERDLHYVITTDGRVTDWAQRCYEDPVPPATSSSTGAVCRLNFSFTVRSVMAPVSQLLVYYVTPLGEPVSDVISFDVKLLHRQVYVNLEEREWWLPNQPLNLEVVAEPASLVCLLGSRSGGSGDIRFDPRISEEREPTSVAGEVDFLEAGVSFFQRQCVKKGKTGVSAVSYRQRGSGAGPSNRRRPPESLVGGTPLDQLWLWNCFNYTSEMASTGLSISAPQEAGKWSLWALTVSSGGLRFSSPVSLQVFRPLQVEFRLPTSLRVRETLEVDIKIGNNINSCMDVTALLALSEGAQFLSNGLLYVTERLRLGPHGATSLVVRLLVTTPGLKNMTVEVNGYSSLSCEGAEYSSNTTLTGAVLRSATVHVHPEGIVRSDSESAYFCANENMIISTSDNYKYEWIGAPRNRKSITVEVKAGNSKRLGPAFIVLSESRSLSDRMYKITIGDSDNSVTWLGRGKHEYGVQLTSVQTPEVLSSDQWNTFWISWEKNVVLFGAGHQPLNNTLLEWKMDKKIKVQQIGFASAWGSFAEFRIWNFNDEAGFSQVLHLDTPKSVVPGSEWGELLVSGGLALPTTLKKHQHGGLSETLASLTSLLALQHLGNKANESLKQEALQKLPGHIQTILSYRKMDNSFSEHQMLSSHKTTVAVLGALAKVQSRFNVDPELIRAIKKWVQLRQEDDGSFTPLSADIKLDLSGQSQNKTSEDLRRLEHVMEMTAETVIALYEIGVENDADAETVQKAKIFLEGGLPEVRGSGALAAVALALALVRSATCPWAVEKLRNASTTEDGEFGWPHPAPKRDAADWLYEAEAGRTLKEPLTATVEDYKASIRALSTFCLIGDLKFAESVTKYMFYRSHMLDRHVELLYPTVKAFTEYDSLAKDTHRSLTISLATSGMELTDTLELKIDRPPQLLHLPTLPTKVFVYATGAGCATVQGRTAYSTYSVKSKTPLLDLWSGIVQEIQPDRSSVEEIEGKLPMLKIKTCFRWKSAMPSGVLRLEVSLFSGFELSSAPPTVIDPKESVAEMLHGCNGDTLWFAFANVTASCPICVQYLARSAHVISSLRPAYARIYPAEREDLSAEMFFHAARTSPLLKGIAEDDLITWFGRTLNAEPESPFDKPCDCALTCHLPEAKSVESDANSTTSPVYKMDELSIATYTINVDDDASNSSLDKPIIVATSRPIVALINASQDAGSSNKSESHDEKKPDKDVIILQELHESPTTDVTMNTLTDLKESTATSTITTPATAAPILSKLKPRINAHKSKFTEIEVEINKPMALPVMQMPSSTPSPTPTQTQAPTSHEPIENREQKASKLYVNKNRETQNVPLKMRYLDTNENENENQADNEDSGAEEGITHAFPPENKNDKYVLLDKEKLWGLLKEVVYDEIRKKSSKAEVEQLRQA